MSLVSGASFGPYEVLGAIGVGGMGEVYRARDTKLDRHVALKILPESFAHDPERLARFEREAKTLASLNHPNIASIYGFEDANSTRALAMELVEGPTLADRIAQGPIPFDEAMAIAKQIADALEAAHEQGIVHRDLKPANVKVRDDGTVKVLDFGLAKALAGDRSGSAATPLSYSPTITSPVGITGIGVILGTAAYMAPEQARGKVVDKRADVWAFGCVVYEMLTGRRAFDGNEVTDVLARVIERDPDFAALPPSTPAAIRRLLGRCFEKDRKRRLADIADARLELEEAQRPAKTDPGPARRAANVRERLVWLMAVLVCGGVSILAARFLEKPTDAPELRADIETPSTFAPSSFALSPDGRHIVFVASGDGSARLWLRSLDSTSARPLTGSEGAHGPFWSPDGRFVGFFASTNSSLKRLDITGGLPQTLAPAPGNRGGSWAPDGTILFAAGNHLSRVFAEGGEVVAVSMDSVSGQVGFPRFLPDGRRFLFFAGGNADAQGIYLGSLDSSKTNRLTAADSAGLYAPPDWLLFVRQGTLVARHFDLARGEVIGDPVTIAEQVGSDQEGEGAFSVSATGSIAYRAIGAKHRQLMWFDRSGKELGIFGPADSTGLTSVTLSRDGLRAAVHDVEQSNTDVFLFDAARKTRFTFDASSDLYPVWSPDGRTIVFDSKRNGIRNLYRKASNGVVGGEELLLASPLDKAAADWSRDGKFLLYSSSDPQTLWDLWVLPFGPDEKPREPAVFAKTQFSECCGQFSPNGRWVAYQSLESGRWDIYVRAYAESGSRWPISTAGGSQVRWSPDGKEIYYIAPDGALMAVAIDVKGDAINPGRPARLFRPRIWGGGTEPLARQQYDVAPDGRFLINVTADEGPNSPITLLLNWKPPSDK